MNELKKRRIKTVLKYTWPFYIIGGVIIALGLNFIFGITHRLPDYKTLTLFVSGEVKDGDKLKNDVLEEFKDNELKSFSCIYANPTEGTYYSKLSIPGYNSADVLIIPVSVLENLNVSAFALDIDEKLYNSYYEGMNKYSQNDIAYGIKINKEKTNEYFALPSEDCYMFLNAASKNIGEYSSEGVKEHNNALKLVQDWGNNV